MKVTVVSSNYGSAMVQWEDAEGLHRGTVPEYLVTDGELQDDLLSLVIPHGVDWTFLLENVNRTVDASVLANDLRVRGIWTAEDARAHPQVVQGAILSAYGVTFSSLMRAVEVYKKSVNGGLSNG